MLMDNSSNIYRNGTEYNSGASSNILEGLYEFLKAAELEHYFEDLNMKLKVRSIQQLKYVDETDLQTMGMTRPEMRRLKKFFAKEFPQTAMGKIRKRLSRTTSSRSTSVPRPEDLSSRMHSFSSNVTSNGLAMSPIDSDELTTIASVTNFSITSNGTNDSCDWRQLGAKHLILQNQLAMDSVLQHGDFGDIYKGYFRTGQTQIQVSVKVVNKVTLKSDVNDFVREIFGHCYLEHPNIVRLYGLSIDDYSIKMVTDLAHLGSVEDLLLAPDSRTRCPVTTLYDFVVQISDAASYLEERRVIHGRLHGRNVLLYPDNKVKLTDAGLYRVHSIGERPETAETGQWQAPELSKGGKESFQSDVWAFGVLLWEMFSYYQHPPSSQLDQSMSSEMDLRSTYFPQPDLCPTSIYQTMQLCWLECPSERPSFYQLHNLMIRYEPQQVIAMVDGPDLVVVPSHRSEESNEPSDGSYSSLSDMQMLYYRADDVIVVLDRSISQYKELWRGCLITGQCGYFKWSNVRASSVVTGSSNYDPSQTQKTKCQQPSPATSIRSSGHNIGEAFSKIRISRRDDKKKQSRLSIDMISGPQNDFRHVGHVGPNGDVFGDVTSLYASSGQKKDNGRSTNSSRGNYSEASSVISSSTLNAAGDDTPPYATIDSTTGRSGKSKVSKKKIGKKETKPVTIVATVPPVLPARAYSDEDSYSNSCLDDLTINNETHNLDESFSLFDELNKQWDMHYSKLETPTSDKVVDIVPTNDSPSDRKSPTFNNDYSEVYDDPQRSTSTYSPALNHFAEEQKPYQNNSNKRSASFVGAQSHDVGKSNLFQRMFGGSKPAKMKEDIVIKDSPVYAKVNKASKDKKSKDRNESKKNIISKPILISGPVNTPNQYVDDNFLDCSSEVSSLQQSPRDSVLCLNNSGLNSYGFLDPSPSFNRQLSNFTNNSRGKTSDSTITSVSSASSFASLTSPPVGNVIQGGAALRALRRADGVFRAPSTANVLNRKRPSMGQIQVDQYSNDGTISRTRQPSLPFVKLSTSTVDRRNTLRSRGDNYDHLEGAIDSSATTPIASDLPDLPYIDLSFVRTVAQEKVVVVGDEEDAYNSLHSGSLGSDTIEQRTFTRQADLYSTNNVKDGASDSVNSNIDINGKPRSGNNSKYAYNFSNSSNLFSMNGDNDEVAL